MGFLGAFFGKKKKASPLDALRERVDASPNDARLASDLAGQLKAEGDLAGAQEYAQRAAQAHLTAGFAQKALAVLKGAVTWGPPTPELLQDLINVLVELKHKEDARGALSELRKLHSRAGKKDELERIDAQLADLGPGR